MKPIRVLIVDDSAFARKVLKSVLKDSPNIEVVGTAHDGLEALERIAELSPDVVTLDLVMPNLDGVGVLQGLAKLSATKRPRVIVVSMSDVNGDLAIRALREGAFDIVHKPTALASEQLYEVSAELRHKIELAAAAKLPEPLERARRSSGGRARHGAASEPRHGLVVIGASTGGPQAVTSLLSALPDGFPVPIAVVVHIPIGFSKSFAEHLDRDSRLSVREATHETLLQPGQAVVARAGMHLTFQRSETGLKTLLAASPAGTLHRPSVDVTFQSAAEECGAPVLGVVLTGMGNDGLAGARVIRERGGTLLTQNEASSVVYGMPRVVWEEGLASAEADIEDMAQELRAWL